MKNVFILIILILILSSFIIDSYASTIETKKASILFNNSILEKNQLSFAAFADTHIGARYQYPWYRLADHLDELGSDLTDHTNLLDFAIHLGDIINHNTAQVNGDDLPPLVNQYKNNLKAYHISTLHLPFHCVLGNHDINDYEINKQNPHNLTKALIDETNLNNPVYAMMRDGILFLIVPELGLVQWTHPVEYEWVEYMTHQYPDTTTIIMSHQAIEDTTKATSDDHYRAKQDNEWWMRLFQNNSQIKMWIHGHNHYLDWYLDNKSTGDTYPIQNFGHQMVFSAPYSQLDFARLHEEDRIVIYNITSTNINTASWENNGFGGHWVPEYIHSWKVNTTFDPDKKDWYSFPMFLQDNETQLTDMKILSPNITLQLTGTSPMELFYDSQMESPPSRSLSNEMILGFGNDKSGNVEWTNPGMNIHGPAIIDFPEKYPIDGLPHEDGRSGPLYQSFPMGTICSAVPTQTYEFTITAKSSSGNGKLSLNVSCSDWGTKTQYSTLPNGTEQIISHQFGSNYETITGTYTVPDDRNAWFLQGKLNFIDSTDYQVKLFSVKRKQNSNTTNNFRLLLSGCWYNVTGSLDRFRIKNFTINPTDLCDTNGVINFTAFIDGNKFGMANLVYIEPLFVCRNARFKINDYSEDYLNLSLTKTISRYSTDFKLFPFNTDPIYEYIGICANDGSGVRYDSENGNSWLSCNSLNENEQQVRIFLHGGYIENPKENFVYFFNQKSFKTCSEKTIILGNISILANVFDEKNVQKVEFYIDNVKKHEDTNPPFIWNWDEISYSTHKITIKAYHNNEFISTDEMKVVKLL